MRRFTISQIAALTFRARQRGLDGWWLAHGPLPGESVAELLCRADGRAGDLLRFLEDHGAVARPSPLDEGRLPRGAPAG